jgi:hypothetical protein
MSSNSDSTTYLRSCTVRAPCPVCNRGPKDRALSITTDERGTVSHCFRCGYVSAENVERRPDMPSRPVPPKAEPLEWSGRAESIWRRTAPLAGTLGARYIERRGCVMPPADSDLRFLPASDKFPPSLCARITDAVTARPLSLHFTRLAADGRGKAGTDCDKVLLGGHRKKGGVIRLWPDECVTAALALAEGVETALAAAHVFTPAWATVDCGNLGAFPVLAGIEALTIHADNDDAGLAAARTCAQRWAAAGREVRIRRARMAGADVADLTHQLEVAP